MKRLAVILAGLMLASCSKPAIECTRDGMIIIPEGIDTATANEWNSRNYELALDRLDQATGMKPQMREHLVKAQGCP